MPKDIKADFCIELTFKKGTGCPSRVFRSLSELIDTIQVIDNHLVGCIDTRIEPVLMLEDIESGSIRTWLSSVLKAMPDDAIYNLSWKKLVGSYLLKAKYYMINFLEGKTTISNTDEIKPLTSKLHQLAKETEVRMLPDYKEIQPRELLEDMQRMSDNLSHLGEGDSASYITPEEKARFNLDFKLAPETVEELLVHETISAEAEMILKVKKPDYLGESMWEFRFGEHIIPVKIVDKVWLEKFQSRQIYVQPGDSIRGMVKRSDKYDADGNLTGTTYELLKVLNVITASNDKQVGMFKAGEDNNAK